MGGKHIQKRYKRIFHYTGSIFLVILMFGCKMATPPVAVSPSENNRQEMEREASIHLFVADRYIFDDDCEKALADNEQAGDHYKWDKIFQKGVIYAHPKNPDKNYKKSINYFNEILNEKANVSFVQDADSTDKISLKMYNASFVLASLLKTLSDKENKLNAMTAKYHAENELAKSLEEKLKDLESQIENLKEVDLNIEKKRNTMKQNTEGSKN